MATVDVKGLSIISGTDGCCTSD